MSGIPPWVDDAIFDAQHDPQRRHHVDASELGGNPGPDLSAYRGTTPPVDPDIRMRLGQVGRSRGPSGRI